MRVSQPKKHKAACDRCNASKVKCPGGGLPCQRCADNSQSCHYSLARRIGKPPGSKNRKTLERMRQAEGGNLEDRHDGSGGSDSPIAQNNDSRNDSDEIFDNDTRRREGDDSYDPSQMSSTTSFWPMSPLINYSPFPDLSQLNPVPEQVLESDHGASFDGGDRRTTYPEKPKVPDSGVIGRAESRIPWVDSLDSWNVSNRPDCAPPSTK